MNYVQISGNNCVVKLTWSAFHATHLRSYVNGVRSQKGVATCSSIPLFEHEFHSLSMIKHAMTVVKAAATYLNSNQTPVMTCDQPLYALAMEV